MIQFSQLKIMSPDSYFGQYETIRFNNYFSFENSSWGCHTRLKKLAYPSITWQISMQKSPVLSCRQSRLLLVHSEVPHYMEHIDSLA